MSSDQKAFYRLFKEFLDGIDADDNDDLLPYYADITELSRDAALLRFVFYYRNQRTYRPIRSINEPEL